MMHKSQKRKTRRVYRSASKQHSPNRTRNRERLLLCSLSSQSKCPSSRYKSFFVHHWPVLPTHNLMLHRHWRINIVRNQRANNYFVIILHRFGTETYIFMQGDWKSIVMKLIYLLSWQQFNILRLFLVQIFRTKMMKSLTMNPQMMMMSIHAFRTLQRPPSSWKIFL